MPETFYNILTTLGLSGLANAQATQTPLPLVQFAVGDSNGVYNEPVEGQAALVNEVWRGGINRVYPSPQNAKHIVIEALIPVEDGGFNVREAGVFDGSGNLIAVGKYPLTFKPVLGSGSEKDLYVRMILQVTNAANVDQTIDPTLIYLTQWHLDEHADRTDNPHGVTTAQIGAETPVGSQAKVNTHRDVAAPHSGHETPAGAQAKVNAAINLLMNAPPSTLDTLNELAAALGDDPNFATTMTNLVALKETPAGAQAKVDTHKNVAAPHSGHETPAGAQAKVDAHDNLSAPHSGHETPAGAQDKVNAAVTALLNAPPATLDTLNELAAALGDDPNFATTITNALAAKETPAGAQAKVDAHKSLTNPHSATSTATANRLALRDAAGRMKAVAGSASADVVVMSQLPAKSLAAMVSFAGPTAAISASHNIGSVVRGGVGLYTITFAAALADTAYTVAGMCSDDASSGIGAFITRRPGDTKSATTYVIRTISLLAGGGGVQIDAPEVEICFFR